VIESGRIEILREEDERLVRLAVLQPGQIFGEMGLVDERPRSLTARAVEVSRVTTVTRDELVELLFHRPEEGLRYIRTLFERLRAMNTRVAQAEDPPPAKTVAPAVRLTLLPLTDTASRVVPKRGRVIERLPFRIGRASEGKERDPLGMNDLSLPDEVPYHVSRNHLALEQNAQDVVVRDRGSFLGTIVNGVHVGGRHRGAEARLVEGENELALGSADSPYRFRVIVERDPGF
jgi:hypothetical protein